MVKGKPSFKGSRAVGLDMERFEKRLGDCLLAKVTKSVAMKGFDEIGGAVSVRVVF